MSRLVNSFTTLIPTPLTQRDFTMLCPEILSSCVIVQSATLPAESVGSVSVPIRGQSVSIPTRFNASGTWTFTIADNAYTAIRYSLMSTMYNKSIFDITLLPSAIGITAQGSIFELLTGTIPSALTTLGGLNVTQRAAVSALLSGVTLKQCFIKSISEANFSASSTDAVTWSVSVQYSYIEPTFGTLSDTVVGFVLDVVGKVLDFASSTARNVVNKVSDLIF